ncbi:MAG: hypothetical protein P1U77_18945 [Rubripirellula sp.]|nr:hypothetical protein [Rubripirellula sp.]
MPKIECECPHCTMRYEFSTANAGKNAKCRNCHGVFTIQATQPEFDWDIPDLSDDLPPLPTSPSPPKPEPEPTPQPQADVPVHHAPSVAILERGSNSTKTIAVLLNLFLPPFGYLVYSRVAEFFFYLLLYIVLAFFSCGMGWFFIPLAWIGGVVDVALHTDPGKVQVHRQ